MLRRSISVHKGIVVSTVDDFVNITYVPPFPLPRDIVSLFSLDYTKGSHLSVYERADHAKKSLEGFQSI